MRLLLANEQGEIFANVQIEEEFGNIEKPLPMALLAQFLQEQVRTAKEIEKDKYRRAKKP